jgi:hypothetical protein
MSAIERVPYRAKSIALGFVITTNVKLQSACSFLRSPA